MTFARGDRHKYFGVGAVVEKRRSGEGLEHGRARRSYSMF